MNSISPSSAADPGPAILIVEDDDSLREALGDSLCDDGFNALSAASGPEALAILAAQPIALVISDVQMSPMSGTTLLQKIKVKQPELPVVLMTAYGTIQKAVDAMRDGAVHYLVKPFAADTLVETVRRFLPVDHAGTERNALIAQDPRALECVAMARRVAPSDATVMLHGQSGTGKEVYARFIHDQSTRAAKPFVAINCAAIPESMLEAVLFGHEKGSFTGAGAASAGKFEQAQGGTLLLDEISEMDLSLQAKLLRVLQEKEVERLGGHKTIKLDVRVLATTNRDLRQHVDAGQFREDLFYRLNVFPIALPALCERPADILPLARHSLLRCGAGVVTLGDEACAALTAYHWPGNVRELDNVIQRGVILRGSGELQPADLMLDVQRPPSDELPESDSALRSDLRTKEEELILAALRAGDGTRKDAAQRLGISPRTLRYKIARLRDAGIAIPRRISSAYA